MNWGRVATTEPEPDATGSGTEAVLVVWGNRSRLDELLTRSAEAAFPLQTESGAMPPGHNGPWGDIQTPLRNTGHWLITFLRAHRISGDERFLVAASRTLGYLQLPIHRPAGAAFRHFSSGSRPPGNGLIGQAWTLEALAEAGTSFNRADLMDRAAEVFLLHQFDEGLGLFHTLDIDGCDGGINPTVNQQIWFAAAGTMIRAASSPEILRRVDRFLDQLPRHLTVDRTALLRHSLNPWSLWRQQPRDAIRRWLARLRHPGLETLRSIGYHAFFLYGLALLRRYSPQHSLWDSPQLRSSLNFIRSDRYASGLVANPFAFRYNPVGFEVPFVYEAFGAGPSGEGDVWLRRQAACMAAEATRAGRDPLSDTATLAARIYEVTRLSDLSVIVGDAGLQDSDRSTHSQGLSGTIR